MSNKELSKRLTSFNGVYLSGFNIQNPASLTAMALLFEKVYLPNQSELIVEFAKKYKYLNNYNDKTYTINITTDADEKENPFINLNAKQQETVKEYIIRANAFYIKNYELFGSFLETDMFKEKPDFAIELKEKNSEKGTSTYIAKSTNSMQLTIDENDQINNRLKRGSVPILGIDEPKITQLELSKLNERTIATLLAMQSIEMVLPNTQFAEPQVILETRDRLSEHLPPFWSAMLKFSKDGKQIFNDSKNVAEAISECKNMVDTTIRPILIDLNEKIIREQKNWFYRILSPIGGTLKLVVGKPSLSNLDLISTSMALATDTTIDYLQHKRKLKELQSEAGLTYLIKLGDSLK